MPVPTIVVVDGEGDVLDAMERDVHDHYGDRYRLVRAGTGNEALAMCSELRDRAEPVAVLVAAHRLPDGSGISFLEDARALHPDAGRVLLTAHATAEAAIIEINEIGLSRYLVKPWHPPEATLYPVLDEVLDGWRGRAELPYLMVRGVIEPITVSIRDDAVLREAAEMVARSGLGDLMVFDHDGVFVGVLSEGDILRNCLPAVDEILLAGGTLYDSYQLFMRKSAEMCGRPILPLVITDPLVIHPDDHVAKAATVLIQRQIRRLPVVEDGRLVGIVSRADICRATVGATGPDGKCRV